CAAIRTLSTVSASQTHRLRESRGRTGTQMGPAKGAARSLNAAAQILPRSPEPVSQFHAKRSSILDNGRSLNLLPYRITVMFVKEIIEARRDPEFSQKIFGIQRDVSYK